MLAENIKKYADELITRYPVLAGSFEDILKAYEILEQSYTNGGKLLIHQESINKPNSQSSTRIS